MVVLEVKDELIWNHLPQFAGEQDDRGQENIDHICREYGLDKEKLTQEMIDELYEYTDCDTEVIARIIDKYWAGTYLVEYVDDRNTGHIRALQFEDTNNDAPSVVVGDGHNSNER